MVPTKNGFQKKYSEDKVSMGFGKRESITLF